MRLILSSSVGRAEQYLRQNSLDPRRTVIATSPRVLEGTCPAEIHVVPGCMDGPEFWDTLDVVLECEKKSPVHATWFWDGKLIGRESALARLGVGTAVRRKLDAAQVDADKARALLDQALYNRTHPHTHLGNDELIAAAQVYATLALIGDRP